MDTALLLWPVPGWSTSSCARSPRSTACECDSPRRPSNPPPTTRVGRSPPSSHARWTSARHAPRRSQSCTMRATLACSASRWTVPETDAPSQSRTRRSNPSRSRPPPAQSCPHRRGGPHRWCRGGEGRERLPGAAQGAASAARFGPSTSRARSYTRGCRSSRGCVRESATQSRERLSLRAVRPSNSLGRAGWNDQGTRVGVLTKVRATRTAQLVWPSGPSR